MWVCIYTDKASVWDIVDGEENGGVGNPVEIYWMGRYTPYTDRIISRLWKSESGPRSSVRKNTTIPDINNNISYCGCVGVCAELRKVEVSRSRVARGPFGGGLNDKVLPQMFCNLSDFSSDVDAFSIVLFLMCVCV